MEAKVHYVKGAFRVALLVGMGLTIGKNLGELANNKLNEFLHDRKSQDKQGKCENVDSNNSADSEDFLG